MIQVIVPTYNCMKWLPKSLASLAIQRDVDFNVVVVDDVSTDAEQNEFIEETCRARGWTAILNETRMKCPFNIWNAINHVKPEYDDIIFILDGDDWLPGPYALKEIESYYRDDPDLLLTYGSYVSDPEIPGPHPAEPYPKWVIDSNIYRYYSTCYNHPITFKYRLWKNAINEYDLKDDSGNWFEAAYDECIMYPLLESCGGNFKFIEDQLYVYNASNPISESKTVLDISSFTTDTLKSRPVKNGMHLNDLVRSPEVVYYVISQINEATFSLDIAFPDTYRDDIARHLDNANVNYDMVFSDIMMHIKRKDQL